MCVIGGQLLRKSGLLILVNFTNLGFYKYLVSSTFHVVGLPQNHSAAPAGARHSLPAGAVRHSPCAGRQLHFHQSFPWAPTGVSEFARWRRDDDSQKPTWHKESSQPWSAQVEQGGAAQVGRAGTLKAPGDGMLSAQLGPKA